MSLSPEQLAQYQKNGYITVNNLVSDAELVELRQRIDDIQAGKAAVGNVMYETAGATNSTAASGLAVESKVQHLRKLSDLAPRDPLFHSIACKPEIVSAVTTLVGEANRVLLYADQAMLKPAYHGSAKPLHQDNSYFQVTPMDFGVTCWLAIDDATIENGCMNYIPGSHKLGLIPHREIANTPHRVPITQNLDAEVPCPIPAGSVIFHHLLTLHSSKPNHSPYSRRAWALHYLNAEASCESADVQSMLAVN